MRTMRDVLKPVLQFIFCAQNSNQMKLNNNINEQMLCHTIRVPGTQLHENIDMQVRSKQTPSSTL